MCQIGGAGCEDCCKLLLRAEPTGTCNLVTRKLVKPETGHRERYRKEEQRYSGNHAD